MKGDNVACCPPHRALAMPASQLRLLESYLAHLEFQVNKSQVGRELP